MISSNQRGAWWNNCADFFLSKFTCDMYASYSMRHASCQPHTLYCVLEKGYRRIIIMNPRHYTGLIRGRGSFPGPSHGLYSPIQWCHTTHAINLSTCIDSDINSTYTTWPSLDHWIAWLTTLEGTCSWNQNMSVRLLPYHKTRWMLGVIYAMFMRTKVTQRAGSHV